MYVVISRPVTAFKICQAFLDKTCGDFTTFFKQISSDVHSFRFRGCALYLKVSEDVHPFRFL